MCVDFYTYDVRNLGQAVATMGSPKILGFLGEKAKRAQGWREYGFPENACIFRV